MRKILLTAFAMGFVSVQAVSRLRTIMQERAEVAQITSLPKSGDYEFMGCFADTENRAIPNYAGWVKNADECRAKAEANKHDVFGLQYRGQCWTGKNDTAFDKYGSGPLRGCQNVLGGTSTNMVYKRKILGGGVWTFKGCWKDDIQFSAIPNYLGEVWVKEECQKMAEERGFNTFGIQNLNHCFVGKSPAYDKVGPSFDCDKGGFFRMSVYAITSGEWTYKGCFKDDGSRLIPKYLQDVASVDACKNLAVGGGFDTFSLQSDGECFVGHQPRYNKLGLETKKENCPVLGGEWSNQVYQLA